MVYLTRNGQVIGPVMLHVEERSVLRFKMHNHSYNFRWAFVLVAYIGVSVSRYILVSISHTDMDVFEYRDSTSSSNFYDYFICP